MDEEPMDFDGTKIVKAYIRLRNARRELSKKFEEEDAVLKGHQEVLENTLLNHFNQTNITSIKTEHGTAYKQEDFYPQGQDWDAFYKWVGENDAFDALERRIKKGFITDYMAAHSGKLPPGVAVVPSFVVR